MVFAPPAMAGWRRCAQARSRPTDPRGAGRQPTSVPYDGASEAIIPRSDNTDEQIEIKFSDLQFICDYSNDASIMRVGKQIRRYLMGTPMGEHLACI
eukprot:COSAG05_NODE_599_length_8442_cov_52.187268_11_plen_97_part_00